jgi:hypothetical protein
MNIRELDCNGYLLATVCTHMGMRRDTLWLMCICIVLVTSNDVLLDFDFDLVSCCFSYVNFSIGGRVCKAGVTPRPLKRIFIQAEYSHQFCSSVVRELHHAHHLQGLHSPRLCEESSERVGTLQFVLRPVLD